jgi:phage/plasmid-like protein (TIGR03299 family)
MMPANVQSMAYVDKKPWHGMGTEVEQGVHADRMIHAAGLDWTVEKQPARGAKPIPNRSRRAPIYSRYEIVRLPRNYHEPEVVLGIVSDRYEPLQNHEAFAFFDPIVDRKTACFETAGVLGEGERVWILAKMPDVIQVVRDDVCQKYLLLANAHTGQGSVIVKFTPIRVVCQNTLMLAMDDGQKAYRIRHSKVAMTERLREVAELIAAANAVYVRAAEMFRKFAGISMDNDKLKSYLEVVFPQDKKQKEQNKTPRQREDVRELFDSRPDLQMNGVRGTLWAAYNAVTRFEDYRNSKGESDDSRLTRVWFGRGADLKLRALQAAVELVKNN